MTTTSTSTSTTTITSDPGILCFHHCNVKVFCFTLPHTCPHCNAQLDADANAAPDATGDATVTRLLPFRLPYPFVRATQHPCAIVLRPSTGDFLNDYSNATDLHIAVTTSAGDIVEFDRYGLRRHRRDDNPRDWRQSLLVGDLPEPWHDYWDEILDQICGQSSRWSIECYEETSHNCYAFVLAFLQALGHAQLSDAARTKTSFCEKYIVPRTTTAGKYISLYRRLRHVGIYVHRQQPKSQSKHRALKVDICDGLDNSNSNSNSNSKLSTSKTKLANNMTARLHVRQKLCTIEE